MKIIGVILFAGIAILAGHFFGDGVFGAINKATGLSIPVSQAVEALPAAAETDSEVEPEEPAPEAPESVEPEPETEVEPAPEPESEEPAPYSGTPVAYLGDQRGGTMRTGEFRAQSGLWAKPGDGSDTRCDVLGFYMTYLPRRADPIEARNQGTRYTGQTSTLQSRAKPGDTYVFSTIKVQCGDSTIPLDAGSMVFFIK